jgi:hypothetical protein
MEMGRTAADTLLKGKNYANLSAAQAILKWAPPSENDTDSYIKGLSRRTGLDMSRRYSDMTPEEQRKFLDAMYQIEGGKVGRVTAAPEKRALGSLGATGRLFENFGGGKLMQLDNIESVQTPQQMAEVVKNVVKGTAGGLMGSGEGSQNGLADLLSTLNSNITALIKINKDALDVHRQHLTATRGMQGDLYKV